MTLDEIDRVGLIAESYRIADIHIGECRSIFLDWALKLPNGVDQRAAIALLIETYGKKTPKHPMSIVLQEGLGKVQNTGRRGGRAARFGE